VQSVREFALREINALEQRIVKSEDDADAMLWEQASQVVEQLKAGLKQRDIARQWINARTGEPYSHNHVGFVARVFGKFTSQPRPTFREAYNEIANASKKSVHFSSETPEHYTPAGVLALVKEVFGDIPDLDPCSNSRKSPNVKARRYYTEADDGLAQDWGGRVFMNPPYGHAIGAWIEKLRQEWNARRLTEAIALLPSRTDTDWFEQLTSGTDDVVLCFLKGRLIFIGNSDPAPFPSLIAYFGPKHDVFAQIFAKEGSLWMRPSLDFFVNHE
jgi:hypothetical protein